MKTRLVRAATALAFVMLALLLGGQARLTIDPEASTTQSGWVTAGTQSFGGAKTFTGGVTVATVGLTVTGALNGNETAGAAVQIGSYNGTNTSAIWGPGKTATTANYDLYLSTAGNVLSTPAGTSFQLANGGTGQTTWDSSGNMSLTSGATKSHGHLTLSAGGGGTLTVVSGTVCTCSDDTAAAAVSCPVVTTTATFAGTANHVISYICL